MDCATAETADSMSWRCDKAEGFEALVAHPAKNIKKIAA